jgi:hypothetical protein
MKKLFISAMMVLVFGLTANLSAQQRPPVPPHPSKSELINHKMNELDKRYKTEKRLIQKHPLLTKKMKRDQIQALDQKYRSQKQLLKKMK